MVLQLKWWTSCLSQCSLQGSCYQFSSVQLLSRVWLFVTPWTKARQLHCPSPTPGVYPNSYPLSQWCHPTISSSAVLFSSCPQSFPASGSFQMSQLFVSGGQSIGVSPSTSVLPMNTQNTQDWSPLGWNGWISLQSKGLSRVFSNKSHSGGYKIGPLRNIRVLVGNWFPLDPLV